MMSSDGNERSKLFRERIAIVRKQHPTEGRKFIDPIADECHDPIEDDPAIRPLLEEAKVLAEAELSGVARGMGFCHLLWQTKQRIMLERFGITWFSPAEMNPNIRYD